MTIAIVSAISLGILLPVLMAMLLPFLQAAQEKEHARRMADAKMNARLLSLIR